MNTRQGRKLFIRDFIADTYEIVLVVNKYTILIGMIFFTIPGILTFLYESYFHGLKALFLGVNDLLFCLLQKKYRKKQNSRKRGQYKESKSDLGKNKNEKELFLTLNLFRNMSMHSGGKWNSKVSREAKSILHGNKKNYNNTNREKFDVGKLEIEDEKKIPGIKTCN